MDIRSKREKISGHVWRHMHSISGALSSVINNFYILFKLNNNICCLIEKLQKL